MRVYQTEQVEREYLLCDCCEKEYKDPLEIQECLCWATGLCLVMGLF